MTKTRTYIDPTGKKLAEIIKLLIGHEHSYTKLPRGLILAWRVIDPQTATFTATRPGVLPGDEELFILRRDAPGALDIGCMPAFVTAAGKDKDGAAITFKGYQWRLAIVQVPIEQITQEALI